VREDGRIVGGEGGKINYITERNGRIVGGEGGRINYIIERNGRSS
jgi:ribosomal protein L33